MKILAPGTPSKVANLAIPINVLETILDISLAQIVLSLAQANPHDLYPIELQVWGLSYLFSQKGIKPYELLNKLLKIFNKLLKIFNKLLKIFSKFLGVIDPTEVF